MKRELFVATANRGKLRDLLAAASSFGVEISPMPHLDEIEAPAENGSTFLENARSKALYYASFAPDLIVVADDSGLEVDALNGRPGVRSARYAADAGVRGELEIDAANNAYLLDELTREPPDRRTARYKCVLCAAKDTTVIAAADGTVEGEILTAPRGSGGFGYDPLFYLPMIGKTMAEIDVETKLSLSHRGAALRKLLTILKL